MDWQNYRVCIGLCNNQDKIDSSFFWQYLDLVMPKQHIAIRGQSTIKAASLNEITKEAWKWGCQKIIFMDIDQSFPFDTIPKLLTRNLPIVSGLYHLKKYPYSPIAGWRKGKRGKYSYVNGKGEYWKENYSKFPDNENHLVEVDWTGIGCLMVDMDVFNKIRFPCFNDIWSKEYGVRKKGHDVVFSDAVKKAGYKIYVDTLVQCDHMGKMAVNDIWVDSYHSSNIHEKEMSVLKNRIQGQHWWDERHFGDRIQNLKRVHSGEWGYIIDNLIPKSKVADVGCGRGFLMEGMKKDKDCECYGYDISPVAIGEIRSKGFKGEVADFRAFNGNKKSYDAVVSSHLLEHMEDDEGFLKKCASLLNNGGKVIVSVPTEDNYPLSAIEHQRVYTQKGLAGVMKKVFKNVNVKKVAKTKKIKKGYKQSKTFVAIGSQPHGI